MTVRDAINRGNNLLGTAIIALAGFAFATDMFAEDRWQDKLDEGGLFILSIIAIAWYKIGRNRFSRSTAPIIFTATALVIKIIGLIIEYKDKEDAGDEFGGVILFALATIFLVWIYIKSKKLLSEHSS